MDANRIIWAVDCGSDRQLKSQAGILFQPDSGYSPNTKTADYSTNQEAASATVKYTSEPALFLTERHADETFYYDIPVSSSGFYVVISRMAEMWHREAKRRIFNINIGDCAGETGVDIYKNVGRFAVYDSYVEFQVKGGEVYVKGQKCDGAYRDKKVRVNFVKIGVDNPKVDAIMLFNGALADTDYAEQASLRKEWDRRFEEEARRKEDERIKKEEAKLKRREKVKVRNDDYEEMGEYVEEVDRSTIIKRSFADYVSDYFGLIILATVAFFIVYPLLGKSENITVIEEQPPQEKAEEKPENKTSKKKTK